MSAKVEVNIEVNTSNKDPQKKQTLEEALRGPKSQTSESEEDENPFAEDAKQPEETVEAKVTIEVGEEPNPEADQNEKKQAQEVNEMRLQKLSKDSQIFSSFNLQKFLMEFIGSFGIVYFGNWAQIFSDLGMSNPIACSLTIGLIMTIFTWIGVDVSGAHFNPITTVNF